MNTNDPNYTAHHAANEARRIRLAGKAQRVLDAVAIDGQPVVADCINYATRNQRRSFVVVTIAVGADGRAEQVSILHKPNAHGLS